MQKPKTSKSTSPDVCSVRPGNSIRQRLAKQAVVPADVQSIKRTRTRHGFIQSQGVWGYVIWRRADTSSPSMGSAPLALGAVAFHVLRIHCGTAAGEAVLASHLHQFEME